MVRSHIGVLGMFAKRVNAFHYVSGRRPTWMPLGEWQKVRGPTYLVWGCCTAIGVQALILALMTIGIVGQRQSASIMFCLSLGTTAAAIMLWALPALRERRFKRGLRALDYNLCLNCGYDLRGLPDLYQCPECGVEYDREKVRSTWQRRFDNA